MLICWCVVRLCSVVCILGVMIVVLLLISIMVCDLLVVLCVSFIVSVRLCFILVCDSFGLVSVVIVFVMVLWFLVIGSISMGVVENVVMLMWLLGCCVMKFDRICRVVVVLFLLFFCGECLVNVLFMLDEWLISSIRFVLIL